jgi:release factor glutamine methyltransferase
VSTPVRQLLQDCGLPVPEGRALLAHAGGFAREFLIAHPQHLVDSAFAETFTDLAAQRRAGTPMAYLLGVQEFFGHRFRVTPDVLIPRPETEMLVELVLEAIAALRAPAVLELGTGSGCIAACLALARPDAAVTATDVSRAALAVARENLQLLGARATLTESDWYAAIDERFDLIVSNPPYVAGGDPHLDALRFEPRRALTDEADGLGPLRAIVAGAPAHLKLGGRIFVEHGYDQGAAVRELLIGAGFEEAQTLRDLAGHDRVGVGEGLR